jgi:TRAP-type C4-dicarboxylate transport system substrate-binding protein
LRSGFAVTASLALTSCAGGGGGGAAAGEDALVPVGASAEEYASALADMEETTLVFNIGSGPEAQTSQPIKAFAERVAEYSGGKIEMELAWSNSIIQNTAEIDRGLLDGRIDIGVIYASYNAEDYPVNNSIISTTVLRDPTILSGTLSSAGAYEETTLGTPEAVAEFTDQGITPLYMMQPESPTVMFCTEPLTSLADLKGKQIRAATPGMATQLEGLGAVPVSMAYTEVYEALQRGILDCGMGIHSLGTVVGLFEVAPFILHTAPGAAFVSTPTPYYAGVRFAQMPSTAQQLVTELFATMQAETKEAQVKEIVEDGIPLVEQHGGGFYTFESDVTERLKEVNEELLEEVRNSSLYDGNDFIDRLEANTAKWKGAVEDMGYVDAGPVENIGDWYSDDLGSGYSDYLPSEISPLTVENRP